MRQAVYCALLFAFSAATQAADLVDVFRLAQRSDTAYAGARATWAAAQERVPQARAGLLPLVSASGSTQFTDRVATTRDDASERTTSTFASRGLSLSVTQPLYRRQNTVVFEQALTQVEQADAQLALAAQDLILRVAQAYFDALLAQDNVAFAQAQKTAIGQQLEQARRNFEVGTATITDTHEAQARFDLTTAQEIAANNDLELRRRALEQIIARTAPPLAPLGAQFALKPPEPAVMDTWAGLAQQSNLQVRIAQSALTFANQEIERNRGGHYPTLDLFATASTNNVGAGSGAGSDTRSNVVGLQLAFPLYSGGAVSSRVRESIANEDRARQDLEGARRTAEFTARQAFLGITNGLAQVRALEAALVSTQSQLASTRLGQEVGVRTQVDVLNAQQLLFSARRDLASSKYTYVLSLLRLEAAIGELTETDLLAVNQWLDPAALNAPPAAVTTPLTTTPVTGTPLPAKPVATKP
ncbi:MAG: TolC family outer membrane protein [Pseudomonadota bacterium]